MGEIRFQVNSIFNSISYRVGSTLLDPGDEWEGFENVEAVLLTHAHFDHIYGLNRVVELNPCVKVFTNSAGKEMLLNSKKNLSFYLELPFVFNYPNNIIVIEDGAEVFALDEIIAKAIHTPGHNPSCITWLIGNNLFTGDSYIPGIQVVTNLPNASKQQALESENNIINLSVNYIIYPGHKI